MGRFRNDSYADALSDAYTRAVERPPFPSQALPTAAAPQGAQVSNQPDQSLIASLQGILPGIVPQQPPAQAPGVTPGIVPGIQATLPSQSGRGPNLSPNLINAMIQTESGGDPNAVSPAGARGLMQIMPNTAKNPGFGMTGIDPDDLFDPVINRGFGTQFMGRMLNKYGDLTAALAAYNAGPGFVDKWLKKGGNPANLPEETRNYIDRVISQL